MNTLLLPVTTVWIVLPPLLSAVFPGNTWLQLTGLPFFLWAGGIGILSYLYFRPAVAPPGSAVLSAISMVVLAMTLDTVLTFTSGLVRPRPSRDALTWRSMDQNAVRVQQFLDDYPDSAHSAEARARLIALEDPLWQEAITGPEPQRGQKLVEYLTAYPKGRHRGEALGKQDDSEWELARNEKTEEGYVTYLTRMPNGRHVNEAREALKNLKK